MSDYWSVIDDIRTVLENTDSIYAGHREMLRGIARNYDAAVGDINGRLRQCAQYLRKGNLSEAVRLAETEPNLLDSFTVLDFPERASWNEVLVAMELPPASSLNREIARELGDAFSQTAPLEPLLRKHRFLALALAPLSLRLQTLREIAVVDPTNPAWCADVEAYEKERLVELRRDADDAIRTQDLPRLTQLDAELASPDWRIGIPNDLRADVQRETLSLKSGAALVSLRKLAGKLVEAYRTQNLQAGLSLREAWLATTSQFRSPIPNSLQKQAEPALDWLRFDDERKTKEKEYNNELHRLETALQENVKPEELGRIREDAAELADSLGKSLPKKLEQHYEAKLAAFREAEKTKRKTWLVGGTIAAVFFVVMLAFLLNQSMHLRNVGAAVAEIDAVIEAVAENRSPATKEKSKETLRKYRDNPLGKESAVRERLAKLEKTLDEEKTP